MNDVQNSGPAMDFSIFWQEALKQLRQTLSEQEWFMWFRNINFQGFTATSIVLGVPSSFYRDQVRARYGNLIIEKLFLLTGTRFELDFQIMNQQPAAPPEPPVVPKQPEQSIQPPQPVQPNHPEPIQQSQAPQFSRELMEEPKQTIPQEAQVPKTVEPDPIPIQEPEYQPPIRIQRTHPDLRDYYSFQNFIVGENNAFAFNAAQAIAKNPGRSYNPCFFYGGVGLGKTHLLQAVGNYAYQENDKIKIIYTTTSDFIDEFVKDISSNARYSFKSKYRKADILLVDDIQFLDGKTQTQQELFDIFNTLYDSNKQMVFTCDRPVSEMRNITDRLKSRFERGLNVDMAPPKFETRMAILQQKAKEKKVSIPQDVIELIGRNITSNIRDLEAALTKLIAYSELVHRNITLDVAQQQLKDSFSTPRQSNITIPVIQKIVSQYFNLTPQDLKSKKKTKAIVLPRQIAMYITREMTEYSTTEVGLEFGGRDHTTVMHSCSRIENRMKADPTIEPTIEQIIRTIKQEISEKG